MTNFDLRALTGQRSIHSRIMANRLRWLGHMMRMPEDRAPKKMLFARLEGVRPQGGTRQRWKDLVGADLRWTDMGEQWSERAQHRDQWFASTERAVDRREKEQDEKERAEYRLKKEGAGLQCPHCDYNKSTTELGLKVHCGHCHPGLPWNKAVPDSDSDDEAAPPPPIPSGPSRHVCPHCGKDCNSGGGLSSHLRWLTCQRAKKP